MLRIRIRFAGAVLPESVIRNGQISIDSLGSKGAVFRVKRIVEAISVYVIFQRHLL